MSDTDIVDRLNCGSPSIPAMRDGAQEIMHLRAKAAGLLESMRLDAETIAAKDRRIAELEKSFSETQSALAELHAMVWGECPSLLNEDSGGCARLDLRIRNLLPEAPK